MRVPTATSRPSQRWIRPLVRALSPYVPGEQPRVKGLIKLNTNENPYPPSPKVLEALKALVAEKDEAKPLRSMVSGP